jgi:hypothetical protein
MENEVTNKVTIWNEGRHEKLQANVAAIYPSGIHGAISAGLEDEGFVIRCGSLDDPEEGLGQQLLDDTDVLLWWGHLAHGESSDALVNRFIGRLVAGSQSSGLCRTSPSPRYHRRPRLCPDSHQGRPSLKASFDRRAIRSFPAFILRHRRGRL